MTKKYFQYTEEMIDFLVKRAPNMEIKELTKQFNVIFDTERTEGHIFKATKARGVKVKSKEPTYNNERIEAIKKWVMLGKGNIEIAKLFNDKFDQSVTVNSIASAKYRYNIKSQRRHVHNALLTVEQEEFALLHYKGKSSDEFARCLNDKFGLTLTSKQMREWRSTRGLHNGLNGRYGEGRQSPNIKPIGYEAKNSKGITVVKIKNGEFRAKHRMIWEGRYGEIPEDHHIVFLDGNKENLELDNLLMVSKEEFGKAILTIGLTEEKEVNKAVYGLAKLTTAIKKNNEKQ